MLYQHYRCSACIGTITKRNHTLYCNENIKSFEKIKDKKLCISVRVLCLVELKEAFDRVPRKICGLGDEKKIVFAIKEKAVLMSLYEGETTRI